MDGAEADKTVIITGGSGLIGQSLTRRLLRRGYRVIVLSRRPPPKKSEGRPGQVTVVWDGKSPDEWWRHADGATAVINLAGERIDSVRWTKEKKKKIETSRIDAGHAVAAAIERCASPPMALIQASATGFYGNRGDEMLTEDSPPGTGFLSDVAQRWEESTQSVESWGLRRVVIRTGVVLSPEKGMLGRLKLPFGFCLGGVPGKGNNWMPWIHLEDEADAIVFLMENDNARGIFNCTSPAPVRAGDFYRTLGKVMKRPVWVPMPEILLKAALGDMARELVLAGQRVVPERLVRLGFSFKYPELHAAMENLLG